MIYLAALTENTKDRAKETTPFAIASAYDGALVLLQEVALYAIFMHVARRLQFCRTAMRFMCRKDTVMPIVRNQISVDHPRLHAARQSLCHELSCRVLGRPGLLSLPIALSRPSRIGISDLHTNDNSVPLFICSGSRWS